MKTVNMILIASILLISTGCGGSRSVNGTWELVSPGPSDPSAAKSIKIISDTHFAFGTINDRGSVFAGGGTYTCDDSVYTEFIQYHTISYLVGNRLDFTCQLDGDTWYHSGEFDIDGRRFTVNEVWQRVKE